MEYNLSWIITSMSKDAAKNRYEKIKHLGEGQVGKQ